MQKLICVMSVVVVVFAQSVLAKTSSVPALPPKAPIVKVTVEGPGIEDLIEITEGLATEIEIYGGSYINWTNGRVKEPSSHESAYTVKFYADPPDSGDTHTSSGSEIELIYAVTYVWDTGKQLAFVYLAGENEDWYRLNVSTIVRDGYDGYWFLANDDWGRDIKKYLPSRR